LHDAPVPLQQMDTPFALSPHCFAPLPSAQQAAEPSSQELPAVWQVFDAAVTQIRFRHTEGFPAEPQQSRSCSHGLPPGVQQLPPEQTFPPQQVAPAAQVPVEQVVAGTAAAVATRKAKVAPTERSMRSRSFARLSSV